MEKPAETTVQTLLKEVYLIQQLAATQKFEHVCNPVSQTITIVRSHSQTNHPA
jgi:hypothetical protein